MPNYNVIDISNGVPVKAWTKGNILFEDAAKEQVKQVAQLPFIFKWLAVMPDVHAGIGATIGSVIPTQGAVIPSAVGVDIGCGMLAVKTSLKASDLLQSNLKEIRGIIEAAIPHGRTNNGGKGDKGAWDTNTISDYILESWDSLEWGFNMVQDGLPNINRAQAEFQLGTLGSGNHFCEVSVDETNSVWFVLHSGSRGIGNAIGQQYIKLAKRDWEDSAGEVMLPSRELAHFLEGTEHYKNYLFAAGWAQEYAKENRSLMMHQLVVALNKTPGFPTFGIVSNDIDCHHNYVAVESHYDEEVLVSRKGAVNAEKGKLVIIPGSMGAKTYIAEGLGNPESFNSCSHGAGRAMSRTQAKKTFSLADHSAATEGVECRKSEDIIDETPGAYKDIDAVMAAQEDLVRPIHTLKQIICMKG